ncbi:MAG: hypothetical protein ORN29_03695, partial [Rhodoferax sp.]|nr:hypothetical protein [Rhodoferax sp.]
MHAVSLGQNYREIETQGHTVDGVFNQETGTVGGFALQGRWQGELGVSMGSLPLWIELDASASQGPTAYRGYLQSNGFLIPLTFTTQNHWQTTKLRLGIPVAQSRGSDNPANLQWLPYVARQSSSWTRNLEQQYQETYSHQSWGAGLLVQWRWDGQWVASVDALAEEAGNTRVHPRHPLAAQPGWLVRTAHPG